MIVGYKKEAEETLPVLMTAPIQAIRQCYCLSMERRYW